MKTLSYYPGCSLDGTAKEFDRSWRALAPLLGMQLVDLEDWSCCGSSAAHATSRELAVALAARNLNLAAAEPAAGKELLVPCAACYARLRSASAELRADASLRTRIEEDLGEPWNGGKVVIKALPEVLVRDIGAERIAAAVVEPLTGLKVACYYGCLLVRPPELTGFDDPEDPMTMDQLVKTAGAEPVSWTHKVECCGGGLAITRRDLVAQLVGQILEAALEGGAEAIVTACPMCQANLDGRQGPAGRAMGKSFRLPVIYVTQLLGLACGLPERRLSFHSHLTPVTPLLRRLRESRRLHAAAGEGGS